MCGINKFGTQVFRFDSACSCPATIPADVIYQASLNSARSVHDCRTVMCQPQTLAGSMHQFDDQTPSFSNAYIDGCA